jgi:geranylgeranyl diphosphate synthase type I
MSVKTANPLSAVLVDAVDRQLKNLVREARTRSPLYGWMEYHLGWDGGPEAKDRPCAARQRGKKVRPLLLLAVHQALGGDIAPALAVAAAVELLHSAALVFDDIQDAGRLRRGRPALWTLCGAGQAINVGVALQAAVHLAVASAVRAGLPADRAVAVGEELGLASLRLAEGQYLDLSFQGGQRPSIEDYMRMCAAKTASLLSAAAGLGALVAGREDLADTARQLGYHLGMYLQIEDDIAGIWGDAGATGKLPADLEAGKKTLPILYLFQLEDPPPELAALGERFFGPPPISPEDAALLRRYALDLGGRGYAEEIAHFHRDLARRALRQLDGALQGDLADLLDEIARSLEAPAPA